MTLVWGFILREVTIDGEYLRKSSEEQRNV